MNKIEYLQGNARALNKEAKINITVYVTFILIYDLYHVKWKIVICWERKLYWSLRTRELVYYLALKTSSQLNISSLIVLGGIEMIITVMPQQKHELSVNFANILRKAFQLRHPTKLTAPKSPISIKWKAENLNWLCQ